MPPEQPIPEPKQDLTTELVDKLHESLDDGKVDEKEQEQLKKLATRAQEIANQSKEGTIALLDAIQNVAKDIGESEHFVISLIWEESDVATWYLANLQEDPKLLAKVLDDANTVEDLWKEVKNLTQEERESHPSLEKLCGECSALAQSFNKLSDAQIHTLIAEHQGFERLTDVYLSIYRTEKSTKNRAPKVLINALLVLAKRSPKLVAPQMISGNFFAETKTSIDNTLGQRELFFAMARNGPIGTKGYEKDRPYMHYAWYNKMSSDLSSSVVAVPKSVMQRSSAVIDGEKHMYLYNMGGFDLARTIAAIGPASENPDVAEELEKSRVLQSMFLYATHPSPINGHVSLSEQMLISLADIAENNPRLFDYFVDEKDLVLGQTPREFFVANSESIKDMPFLKLTDPKRGGGYYFSCKRLVAALDKHPK